MHHTEINHNFDRSYCNTSENTSNKYIRCDDTYCTTYQYNISQSLYFTQTRVIQRVDTQYNTIVLAIRLYLHTIAE